MTVVSTALATPSKPRPHEIVEDVWFGDEGNEWQSEGFVFTAGPMPDLLSVYLIEDSDEQVLHTLKAKFRWLEEGFGEEQWAEIRARIDDPADPMRTQDLFPMYNALIQEVTNRPPTSQTGSSRARSRTTSAAKPKPKG